MPKKVIVGVDIRDLRVARTGTATYLSEVCSQFKQMEDNDIRFHFLDTDFPVYTGENKLLKILEHVRLQVWKQIILPLKAMLKGCNVIFCTDNIVPLVKLGYKTIPVMHDAFFFENPEHYNPVWLWCYNRLALPAARNSKWVVVPTTYAKERIHHFTRIRKEKLVVIYEGPKSLNKPDAAGSAEVWRRYGLVQGNYILHVGITDKRKNLPALILAYKKLKDTGSELKLVLAGKSDSVKQNNDNRAIMAAIKDHGLEEEVILTGYLDDKQLSAIYQGAFMYVFPSVNEGFGIPILEAFRFGIPVLVANNTCLPEVGGNAVITFDPFKTDDIFDKMRSVQDNEQLRQALIQNGNTRRMDFSWQKTATQLADLFKRSINN